MSEDFTCLDCGTTFSMPEAVLARYPGWKPKACRRCRDGKKKGSTKGAAADPRAAAPPAGRLTSALEAGASEDAHPSLRRALERFQDGPDTGVFTDGGASPNPGIGGWGAVRVDAGVILAQRGGRALETTNNRMELQALIEGCGLVPEGEPATLYSDSQLCVKTVNEWAKGWEQRGWKRKSGPIQNLELVQELFSLARRRPELRFEWVPGHSGWRWNEYADVLATLSRERPGTVR